MWWYFQQPLQSHNIIVCGYLSYTAYIESKASSKIESSNERYLTNTTLISKQQDWTNTHNQPEIIDSITTLTDNVDEPLLRKIDSRSYHKCTPACPECYSFTSAKQLNKSNIQDPATFNPQNRKKSSNDVRLEGYINNTAIRRQRYMTSDLSDFDSFEPKYLQTSRSNNSLGINDVGRVSVGGEVLDIEYPEGAASVLGVWTLGLGLLGDSEL